MAEEFLKEEELDSGIVVSRGNEVRFWHLTFQEYLAARAFGARTEEEQRQRLLVQPKLYQSDWREVVLLGGVLHQQGPTRVDAMIASILDGLGKAAKLPAQARCFGLFGRRWSATSARWTTDPVTLAIRSSKKPSWAFSTRSGPNRSIFVWPLRLPRHWGRW